MPSPIRVPIYEKTNSNPDAASSDEDGNDAITAYLTPLLTKHDRGQPLIYEDLLESYEVAKAVAVSSANIKAKQDLENLHNSQLAAYEACARTELTKLAESRAYPTIEEGESMPRYIERCAQAVKDDHQVFRGWRVSNELMEEIFWSKVKAGARKAYFAFKSQLIEKDKERNAPDQTTGKVKAFEAAALGVLVSKSESQDSEMGNAEEGKEGDVEENDMTDGDNEDAEDGEEEEEEEEDGEDDGAEEEGEDIDDENGADEDAADAAVAAAEDNGMPPAKTPMKTKKRRRLPNVPLGGGGTGSTADGGKKQQLAKKQKTGKGANGDVTGGGAGRGGAGGRGKGGSKTGKAGRGGGGGRGTRKRNRKKGTGVGAGGVA